jgi:polyisoprenoid-binding protein YceI
MIHETRGRVIGLPRKAGVAMGLFILLSLFVSTPSFAEAVTYTYDPLHTQIIFGVNHMGFTNSYGRFDKFTGNFTLDEQKPEASSADITIDVNSLDMADKTWNEHVEDKFLEPAKFPTITFKSTKITRTGATTATMTGDLTLHGVTKPVTLNVTLNKVGTNPMMQTRKDAGFAITGAIKRSDFGIAAFIPMVGDEVALNIQVDGMHENYSKQLNK